MAKKKKKGCMGNLLLILICLGIGFYFSDKAINSITNLFNPTDQSEETTVKVSSATEAKIETEKQTEYDLTEMNIAISNSLIEAHEFALTDNDYYYHSIVEELELQDNGALHVIVTDDFYLMSEEEKTLVLQTANNIAKTQIFLKTEKDESLFITAYDKNGNKVAQSKMFNVTEYNFE
ncbi:hypothetical protein WJ437_09150 [Ignavigranum ruoffiae]|uniref:hypothetical protein n=1 Tax=Ignavigranum ruoffiae TaxID=89093 RepID=UPI002354BA0E|nr:hypothetical protein [Ignavigranum ruoffiae]